jgi:hypothetical protein
MPFLPDLLTKLKTLTTALAGFFKGLAEKLVPLGAGILQKLRDLAENIPPEKRRLVFLSLGGGAVLLLLIVGVLLIAGRSSPGGIRRETEQVFQIHIPPEDLFQPREPDFIPGVILDREQRESWTAEDAAPYWQDPLKNGEEQWRSRVEAEIDELMERVP